ncbi:MAG: transposase [Dehalococcoidia bacterium]|nr:transposase [Dehalococcoidia bacterium]
MMVSLLLYAYCLGVRSSRQIERVREVDVAFRVITGNLKPDYSTICRFRSENERELGTLFTGVLGLWRRGRVGEGRNGGVGWNED